MEVTPFWTEFAIKELDKIFNYYSTKTSKKVARKIVKDIVQETLLLPKFPEMGSNEEFLAEKKIEYKYLVYKNYKVIYFNNLQKKRIDIVDVFATSQNPIKIKRIK